MRQPPRNPQIGIFTRPVVLLMLIGGVWSTLVNLGLFYWALGSERSVEQAMTLTFLCLILIELFKAYIFRSDRYSAFQKPFANKWLNLSVLLQFILLGLIVYIPVLQHPFGTYSLSAADWAIITASALTIFPILELGKWMVRRGWLGTVS